MIQQMVNSDTPKPIVEPRLNILGVGVNPINLTSAVETIQRWIDDDVGAYVCVTNVYSVMECRRSNSLRRIHNRSGLTTPDGMPLVWLGRLAGHRHMGRVYGPDLVLALSRAGAAEGYHHFFYGGSQGVADEMAKRLQETVPRLRVVGTHSPPFRPQTAQEDAQDIQMIVESGADIVWVGLGTGKQERWMAAHTGRLPGIILIGVGAAFDFYAGRLRQAPRWMQRSGLEWLFRLAMEPRRLWRRYLLNNPLFVLATLLQLSRVKRYPLDDV